MSTALLHLPFFSFPKLIFIFFLGGRSSTTRFSEDDNIFPQLSTVGNPIEILNSSILTVTKASKAPRAILFPRRSAIKMSGRSQVQKFSTSGMWKWIWSTRNPSQSRMSIIKTLKVVVIVRGRNYFEGLERNCNPREEAVKHEADSIRTPEGRLFIRFIYFDSASCFSTLHFCIHKPSDVKS